MFLFSTKNGNKRFHLTNAYLFFKNKMVVQKLIKVKKKKLQVLQEPKILNLTFHDICFFFKSAAAQNFLNESSQRLFELIPL